MGRDEGDEEEAGLERCESEEGFHVKGERGVEDGELDVC